MEKPSNCFRSVYAAIALLLSCGVAHAQPLAPENLAATPADKQATLMWADPDDADIVRYELRQSADVENLGEWAAIAGSGAGTVEHVASGLANGERHYFELRAVADDGDGPAAAVSVALAAVPDAAVEIADALLRTALAESLGKEPDAELTQGEMATIRDVFAEGWEGARIVDLAGLEFAVNLEWVNLHGNHISDVSAFAGMAALAELDLSANRIVKISALSALTALEYLFLWDNEISDASALANLAALTDLDLSGNRISDISLFSGLATLRNLYLRDNEIADASALSGLSALTTLDLGNNDISDISAFAGLTALTSLRLERNGISNVSALAGLTALRQLHLRGNNILDISALSNLSALNGLYLRDNGIADISALAGLVNLTRLDLHGNHVSDISALQNLTAITRLDLADNNISDISALADLTALRWLYLTGNRLSDVSPLSDLIALRFLYLDLNAIADISPLTTLTSILELSLESNAIENISALADLTGLRTLSLSSNRIMDVSALSSLAGLGILRLRNNRVSDISPLSGLTGLRLLNLYGNNISDVAALSELAALRELDLPDNEIVDVSPLAGLTALNRLFLSGNSISDIAPLADLTELVELHLDDNGVSDIAPLVGSLEDLEYADLRGNPLDIGSQTTHVEALRGATAVVLFDDGAERVPLLPRSSSAGSAPEGFVRVINHSDEAGEVAIEAIDEMGKRFGPATLAIGAKQARQFNAADLESGNVAMGLTGVGEGEGDWRLTLRSDLDIEVLGYARTPDGFVTSLHDLAPESWAVHDLWTFNPASNTRQASRLRLINPTALVRSVDIVGIDDKGVTGRVTIQIPAGRTLTYTARELESGEAEGIVGGLGDGAGKWWLQVYAAGIRVMGLMETATGHLVNLSTQHGLRVRDPAYDQSVFGTDHRIPLFPSTASDLQGFVRAIAPGIGRPPRLTLTSLDDRGRASGPDLLTAMSGGAIHFNSNHLETGHDAKGLNGTGAAVGDWHLALRSNRRVRVLAYGRTTDGFLTSLHDVAPRTEDGSLWIPFFDPGGSGEQVSKLRLVNWETSPVAVAIVGTDDAGVVGGTVRATIPGEAARVFSAPQLESGDADGLTGALGSGDGKWRLRIDVEGDVEAMSLLDLPTGHLTNLSTTPRYP